MSDITIHERRALAALAIEFSWRIDKLAGDGVAALFIDRGIYGYDGFEMSGQQAIDAFYRERRARGKRLSRHIFSPAYLQRNDDETISAWSTLTLYAADGEPPFPATATAIMEYQDHIVSVNSEYRYAKRWVTPLFGIMPHLVAAQTTGGEVNHVDL